MSDSKLCSRCQENKPLEAFWRAARGKYGRHTICKVCQMAADTTSAERNRRWRAGIGREDDRRMSHPIEPEKDWSWRDDAACAKGGYPQSWWFPSSDEPSRGRKENLGPEARKALEVCNDCPVAAQCLEYAMSLPGLVGIWGQATFTQRRNMRRRRGVS